MYCYTTNQTYPSFLHPPHAFPMRVSPPSKQKGVLGGVTGEYPFYV